MNIAGCQLRRWYCDAAATVNVIDQCEQLMSILDNIAEDYKAKYVDGT